MPRNLCSGLLKSNVLLELVSQFSPTFNTKVISVFTLIDVKGIVANHLWPRVERNTAHWAIFDAHMSFSMIEVGTANFLTHNILILFCDEEEQGHAWDWRLFLQRRRDRLWP